MIRFISLWISVGFLASPLFGQKKVNFCPTMDDIVDESFIGLGGNISGFEFPPDIFRTFPGIVDRQCAPYHPLLNPRPHQRVDDFCLPHNPFQSQELVCDRCGPGPENFYTFDIWRHINTINKEYGMWKGKRGKFSFGFCMTCYARAVRTPEATPKEIENGVPITPDRPFFIGNQYPFGDGSKKTFQGTDVQKDSITVTTRVACGKQREDGYFDAPTPQKLQHFDEQLKALEPDPTNPCDNPIFPCGEDNEKRLQNTTKKIARIQANLVNEIRRFKKRDERGRDVNGHHRDLMEIPFGKAHVLRTSINLNDGFKGFTLGITGGRYSSLDKFNKRVPYAGCQAIEYGMAALSPGKVETACWLVPLITNKFATMDGGFVKVPDQEKLDYWRQNERTKDAKLRQEFGNRARAMVDLTAKYCFDIKEKFRGLQTRDHEIATSFCERNFCIPQDQLPPEQYHHQKDPICSRVMVDAEHYKEFARQQAANQHLQAGEGERRQGSGGQTELNWNPNGK